MSYGLPISPSRLSTTTYNHQVHDDGLDFGRLDDVHWNGCDDDQLDDCDEDPLDDCGAWHANGELDDFDDDWRDGCDENWLVLDEDEDEAEGVDEDAFDSDAVAIYNWCWFYATHYNMWVNLLCIRRIDFVLWP